MNLINRPTALALAISGTTMMFGAAANADEGFFIGAGVAYSQIDEDFRIDDIEDISDINFDDDSYSYNFQAGYRFNNWLSVDAAYWDLGEFESDNVGDFGKAKFESEAWTVGGMVSVPLWILDVYARGGAAFWEADGRQVDDDGTDLYYGVGAALNIFRSLDLYAEWVRFDLETDLDTFGVGVRWTF